MSKKVEIEYTAADIEELREAGYSEDELPRQGKHVFRRARHIAPRREHKIKVTMYLDGDVLDYFRERARDPNAAPYQTQINNELRGVMENAARQKAERESSKSEEVVTMAMLENPEFIAALAEKLKAA